MSSTEAAQIISNAPRVGSAAEKSDVFHRAGSFLTESELARGTVSEIIGGDNIRRSMLKVEGMVNEIKGVFEFIIEPNGVISHQLFRPY